MVLPRYDILKNDSAAHVWMGTVHDLRNSLVCFKNISAESPGESSIFDQRAVRIMDKYTMPPVTCSDIRSYLRRARQI